MSSTPSTPPPSTSTTGLRTLWGWVRSVRFPSQLTILLPLIVGQLLAPHQDAAVFAWVLAYGLFDQLYIVWANDYADRHDDPRNPHPSPFAGGSRVLVDGLISPAALGRAAVVAALGVLGVASALVVQGGPPSLMALAVLSLALLWAYSFGPLRLSYRGGGELLQTLGVGGVLPLFGYVAQAGTWASFPWLLLSVFLPLALGTAIATTRPDEEADRTVGKNTFAAVFGGVPASIGMFGANLIAIGVTLQWLGDAGGTWVIAAPTALNFGALFTLEARPGTRLMLVHAFLALMVMVTLLSGIAWFLWNYSTAAAGSPMLGA